MKTTLSFLAALGVVSLVACPAGLAETGTVAYDSTVRASGLGETRELAFKDAIKDARGRCGANSDLVGYDHLTYQHDIGSTFALIDGYCLSKERVEGDSGDSKDAGPGDINTPPGSGGTINANAGPRAAR